MNISGTQNELRITVCESSSDAVRRGYLYRPPIHLPLRVNECVIVHGGMESGADTVDFVCEAASGQKFIFMLSGNLIKTLAGATKGDADMVSLEVRK